MRGQEGCPAPLYSASWSTARVGYQNISIFQITLIIPCHTIVTGYYGFTLDVHVSVRLFFLFTDDNLSKHQWIFTKLGVCVDLVKIWFGIVMDKFRHSFTELLARHAHILVSR